MREALAWIVLTVLVLGGVLLWHDSYIKGETEKCLARGGVEFVPLRGGSMCLTEDGRVLR